MIKTITIVDDVMAYHHRELDLALAGKIKTPISGMIMSPDTFSKIFTPERIKLLQKIYKNNIKNIYQLAKELDKPYEVVFRNIKYLEGQGLIKIKNKDNKKIPYIASQISIDFFPKKHAVT